MIVNSVYILIKKKKVIKLNNIASEVIDNMLSKILLIYHKGSVPFMFFEILESSFFLRIRINAVFSF